MDFVECPKSTLRVDWTGQFLDFQRKTGELVRVRFLRLNSKNNWFKYCCAIAIVQEYCTRDGQDSSWRGVEDTLASKIVERFGWSMKPSTRSQYWSYYFPCGEEAQTPLTEVQVLQPGGTVEKTSAKDVFSRLDGYVLGEPEKQAGAKHEFWRIEFVNQDEEYDRFQTAVLQLIGAGVPTRLEPDLAEQVLSYLEKLEEDCAELPYYFPDHLRREGESAFDKIRQTVRVIEDLRAFDKWLAEERERLRRAGIHPEGLSYGPNRGLPGEMDESYGRGPSPAVIAWDEQAGRRFHQVTILGDPGFGKSWLLRYEARRLAKRAIEALTNGGGSVDDIDLPILMRLPDLAHRKGTFEDIIVTRLRQKHSGSFGDFVRTRMASGHVILLLDAWDEIGDLDARRKLRDKIHDCQLPSRVLLTSRMVGYDLTPPPLPDGKEVELVAWKWEQIQSFVQVWFGTEEQNAKPFLRKLRKHPQFRGLAKIPLMLMLLCRAYPEGDFPQRRSDVYEKCLWGLLRDWQRHDKKRYTEIQLSDTYVEELIEVLAEASLGLLEKGKQQFRETDLRPSIDSFLSAMKRDRPLHEFVHEKADPSRLVKRVKDDGVLSSATSDGKKLRFLHLTFQEYLAARALAKKPDCVEKALKHIYNPAWNQVLVMLGSMHDKPGPYIAALLRRNKEDVLCRPFFLAIEAAAQVDCNQLPQRFSHGIADEMVRMRACGKTNYLGRMADHAFQHLPQTIERLAALVRRESRTAIAAVSILGVIGSEQAVPTLLEAMMGEDRELRLTVVLALKAIGSEQAVPGLVTILRNKDNEDVLRRYAVWALEAIGSDLAVSALVELLPDDHGSDLGSRIAWALGKIGSKEAIAALLTALHDKDNKNDLRQGAAWALGRAGSEQAVPALVEAMQDKDNEDIHGALVSALRETGSEQAVPALVKVLQDRDGRDDLRLEVVQALEMLGSEQAIPALVDVLQDKHERDDLRTAAERALGRIGSEQAVPVLMEVMRGESSRYIRLEAALALGQIGSEQAVSALVEAMQDKNLDIRDEVVRALGEIGSEQAVPVLLEAFHDKDLEDLGRLEITWALEAIGSSKIVLAMIEALRDENRDIRCSAVSVLRGIGSEEAVPALLEALRDKYKSVCLEAALALGEMGSEEALPILLETLQHEEGGYYVRRDTVLALGRIGSEKAVPALLEALHDKESSLPGTVADVLRRVRPNQAVPAPPQPSKGQENGFTSRDTLGLCDYLQSLAVSLDRLADLCENPKKGE